MFCFHTRSFVLLMSLFALAGSSSGAQQQARKEAASTPLELSDGQMFKSYCAPCHGTDAKGNGPAASALKVSPPDLTTLSKRNSGKFPAERVATVLKNGVEVPAHGTAEMPIWGSAFADIKTHRVVTVRITDLVHYLESLQVK